MKDIFMRDEKRESVIRLHSFRYMSKQKTVLY